MLIHNFNPVAINFYIFEVRWYSLAYIFGILLGWYFAKKIITHLNPSNKLNFLDPKIFDDLISYLVIGIIIGGRLGYVLFYNLEYYLENLNKIFYIWEGGMSFHGGLAGIIICTYIFAKKKKINYFYFLDIISIVAPIGIFFGRIANFINSELYGKATDVPWGVIFMNVDNIQRHPSQIYEAFFEGLLLFLIMIYFTFKKKYIHKSGIISGIFLIFYSIFRIILEVFREPDIQLGYIFFGLTMGQILSLIMFFCGILLIYKKNEI